RAIVEWLTATMGAGATSTGASATTTQRHGEGSPEQPAAMTSDSPAAPVAAPVAAAPAIDLMAAVQEVVSERTGYPVDMLEPDLDLEADLSIDSIKRIEIVGELAERIGLGDASGGGLDEDVVEELSRHKTLRAIVEWIESMTAPTAAPSPERHGEGSPQQPAAMTSDSPELPTTLFEVVVEPLGPAVALGDLDGATTAPVE